MSYYPSGTNCRFPTVTNITMTSADTEYELELPEHCKSFIMHTRDESAFRVAFETGHVAAPVAPYFTVLAGTRYAENNLNIYTYNGIRLILYFASASVGKIMEIIYWV